MVSEPTPEVQIDDMRRTLRGCGETIDRLRQRIRELEAEAEEALALLKVAWSNPSLLTLWHIDVGKFLGRVAKARAALAPAEGEEDGDGI